MSNDLILPPRRWVASRVFQRPAKEIASKGARIERNFTGGLFPDVSDPQPELMLLALFHGTPREPPNQPHLLGRVL